MKKIKLNLGNYYGEVVAFKDDNNVHWLELDNYDATDRTNITPELWEALEKEFGSFEVSEK